MQSGITGFFDTEIQREKGKDRGSGRGTDGASAHVRDAVKRTHKIPFWFIVQKHYFFVKTIFTVADKRYIVKGDLQDFQLRDKETVCYNSTLSCARESQ